MQTEETESARDLWRVKQDPKSKGSFHNNQWLLRSIKDMSKHPLSSHKCPWPDHMDM